MRFPMKPPETKPIIYLAVIVWIALVIYLFATGQVNKGISFDMNGNCHGDGCAQWYEEGG
jgi:hypothetical protein